MRDIRQNLEEADEHLEKADEKLRAVAQEVRMVVDENSWISSEHDVEDGSITVSINHRTTVKKLNKELPHPFHAKREDGDIEIFRLEVDVDDLTTDDVRSMKDLIQRIEAECSEGAPESVIIYHAREIGFSDDKARKEIDKLRQKGEVYEPREGVLRTT